MPGRSLRRSTRLTALSLAVGLLVGCAPPEQPDALLLVVSNLRADRLGSYGHHPPGRGVIALAEEGVVFERAISPSPQNAPALASLFTSLLPSRHGLRLENGALDEEPPSLAEAFRDAGYDTVAVSASVALHDEASGLSRGFDRVVPFERSRQEVERSEAGAGALVRDRKVTAKAIEVLLEPRTAPLFLLVHWMAPDPPYDARGRFKRMGQRNFKGPVDARSSS